jgi:uncharacterized integral membrane protein
MSALGKVLVTIFFVGILLWVSIPNRNDVDFYFPPFIEMIKLPLPGIVMASAIFGFLWGGAIVWLNGTAARSDARRFRRELKLLEHESHQKDKK